MSEAAFIEALGRHLSLVLAVGLAAFAVAEAFRPHAAFADEGTRVRHMGVNAGVWLAGFALVDLWLGPWIQRRFPYDPAEAWITLAGWPAWAQLGAGLLLLDLADWTLHWLSHRVRPLWMIHAVHHSDPHVDVTTTLRHHPLEILVSLGWQFALLALVGLPPWIVLLRGLAFMPLTLFHHANVTVPRRLDRALATLVVTPGVHRMHHSPAMAETNSNYGQMFSFWDRLFGTWTPPDYDRVPAYGLERLTDARWQGVAGMLTTPFRAWRLGTL